MPTTKRYRLVLKSSGKQVWSNGRIASARKSKCKTAHMPVTATESSSTPELRERLRLSATKAVKEECVWVDDGVAEYLNI